MEVTVPTLQKLLELLPQGKCWNCWTFYIHVFLQFDAFFIIWNMSCDFGRV